MSNAVQWLMLAVRKVSNVVNVADALIFSPHFIDFRLFHLMVWYDLTAVFDMATKLTFPVIYSSMLSVQHGKSRV